jgi:MraZ protein
VAGFLGSYLHQIDAKGRISLPAPFRRSHETTSFVLVHVQPEALSLYPEDAWLEVQHALREMAKRNPEYRPMILRITANASEVTPDKQGRVLVPDRLRRGVGLDSEALIVGAIDRVEIWEPGRFEASTSVEDAKFDRYMRSIFS